MPLTITPIFAALLVLLFVLLSARVITYRRGNKISLGDAGDKALLKRMRAQANCAEYAPFGVLLLVILEFSGAPAPALYLLGTMLLFGRISHAVGFSSTPQIMRLRVAGMMLTLSMFMLSALGLLSHALF